jgi:excisionase family DNA binding protein
MEAMEVGGRADRPTESSEAADRSVDALLRPGPGEAESAGELLARIDALLGTRRIGRLIGPDGDEVEIPPSVFAALRLVAAAMAQGQAVTVAPHDLELTTQEAADLLHVSRPHLIKLLDKGDLPHHRMSDDPKSHRRVLLKDVMAYRQERQQTRRGLLRGLTQESQDVPGGYR